MTMTKEELQEALDEANETIADLESELDNAKDEIEVLQEDLDAAEQREQDAHDAGYNEALEHIKNHAEELEI